MALMLASNSPSLSPLATKSTGRCPGSGSIYSFDAMIKLLNSSKYMADCVATASSTIMSATVFSGGMKKYGMIGSVCPGKRLNA